MKLNFDSIPQALETEKEPRLLCEISLARHQEALYRTDIPHDLTEKGVEGAKKLGKELKNEDFFSDDVENLFYVSPAERTKGTLHYISEGAGLNDPHIIESSVIGPTKFNDYDTYLAEMRSLGTKEERKELSAKHYHTKEMHDDLSVVAETREDKKERLYRGAEYLIRYVEKKSKENGNLPKILAVSHFEIITHLIDDVFGIENVGEYNSPDVGERVKISVFETGSKDVLLLKVRFRDFEKQVLFNRGKRAIEQLNDFT